VVKLEHSSSEPETSGKKVEHSVSTYKISCSRYKVSVVKPEHSSSEAEPSGKKVEC
tara:strand:+ start:152 stop:319 length:168 start_codon:yes stop_codon:yes gene_type:complete